MGNIKARIFIYMYWLISPIFILAVLEFLLTAFWENPYTLTNNHEQYTRFYPKGTVAYAQINNRLYEGYHRVRFAVGNRLAISDGLNQNKKAASLGGSTTESGLVPEGQRWPDLLKIPTFNYGVSGNTSIDGFYNLKFLIENNIISPEYVFVMYGINDLQAFLSEGADNFKIKGWNKPSDNPLVIIDKADQELFFGIRIKDSSILSFLKYYVNNFSGRVFYEAAYKNRKNQEQVDSLTYEEFNVFLENLKNQFLPMRKNVYLEINRFIKEHKLALIFLTQPHAYRKEFQPMGKGNDLRIFPIVQNKKMTLKQSSIVMDIINNQTREIAQLLDQKLIDVEVCFSKLPLGQLFYDSMHYSLNGSRQFAKCVNQYL